MCSAGNFKKEQEIAIFLLKMGFQGLRGADSWRPIWNFCWVFFCFAVVAVGHGLLGAVRGAAVAGGADDPPGTLRSRGSRAGAPAVASRAAQTCPLGPGLCSGVYLAQN